MRILKLIVISIVLFSVVFGSYLIIPDYYKYEISDWFGRLSAPGFDMPLDNIAVEEQSKIIDEYKSLGYELKCFGNLRPREKIGKHNDYLCWALISTALDDIPARMVTFFFYKRELIHVRLEFPKSSFDAVQEHLTHTLQNKPRLDSLPGRNFKVNNKEAPLMVWKVKEGVVVTSETPTVRGHTVVLWSSMRAIMLRASSNHSR